MYSEYLNNLIITADDFGISEKANRNILELVREKKLDRVEVMMGGKVSKEDAKELAFSGAKLDIHFHFQTKHYFDTRIGESKQGAMARTLLFLVDWTAGRYSKFKVKAIWQKQVEDFISFFGRLPDGISSHEHIHFFPPFFKTALRLRNKYGISYLRSGKKKINSDLNSVVMMLNILRNINLKSKKIFTMPIGMSEDGPYVLNTSDYLVSFDWIKNVEKFFMHLPKNGQTEIVFHPERKKEFKFLKDNF